MDRLREMEVFVRIVDCGSLTHAAEALDVSLPTVVRLLAGLEKRLGVRLLTRTTRRIALTDEGTEFYERSRQIFAELDDAEAASGGAEPRGLLRVTAPTLFGQMHVQPLIHAFLHKYPHVSVDLMMADRNVDLVEERLDVGVRIGQLADSSLVAYEVGDVRLVLCASPEYLARSGVPAHPRDLRKHACLRFTGFKQEWTFTIDDEEFKVPVSGRLVVNQPVSMLEACLDGLGIARFLSYQVGSLIASGRLQAVLTEFGGPPRPVSVVVPSARNLPARTRRLVEWLRAELPPRLAACRT
jgi:DNA-binding transcriptional LysR family regulator